MGYECKVETDSISPDGIRLTTMVVTFPRIVLAEFNTHRVFSRNSASSRAIPVEKQLRRVLRDPFIPVSFGVNRSGMQATEELTGWRLKLGRLIWLLGSKAAVALAWILLKVGVHKQITNRVLEPFMWHTVVVTATEWENFFALRTHKDAQPEIQVIARMMKDAYDKSNPTPLHYEEWHLPFVNQLEKQTVGVDWPMVSAARCARVSYLTHDGKRDLDADLKLAKRLQSSGHMSPFEHAATPDAFANGMEDFTGNFRCWVQLRKMLPNERIYKP